MPLYGNSNGDRIEIPNDSSWNGIQKYSALHWIYVNQLANTQTFFSYQWDGADRIRHQFEVINDRFGVYNYIGGDTVNAESSNGSIGPSGTWQCFCVSFDGSLTSGAIKIYIGDLGGPLGSDDATEGETLTAGATYTMTDSMWLCNNDSNDTAYARCPLSVNIFLADKILTQAQFQELMYNPAACMKYPETVMFHLIGRHGDTNIIDLSGSGNDGTGTGMLNFADEVPLGPMFGRQRNRVPYEVAAAAGNAGIMTLNTDYWGATY
ncbi:MAG: hypothetical protein ACXABY_05030 [Candidatus Thorarchaeota archaeon]|jgi:hypothetical protein